MAIPASIDISGLIGIRQFLFRFGIDLQSLPGLMEEIAQYSMTQIKKRTLSGQDVDGHLFKPYSDKYALFRREKGRPTGKVDLFFSGSMFSSMTSNIDSREIRIFFMNTSDRNNSRNPLKAFFLNQERNFFALSENDVRGIIEIIEEYLSNLIG